MKNLNNKNENVARKYSKSMGINQILKIKNRLLELEKDFIELKDREAKIKSEIEKLFFKPIVSIDDTDKFERKETKKRPVKIT